MPALPLPRRGAFRRLAVLALLAALAGCSAPQKIMPVPLYALDGPPLAIIAEYGGEHYEGSMTRTALVGSGSFELFGTFSGQTCQGDVDSPPNDRGRIHAALKCSDGRIMLLSLRNIGPDQGVGVGRFVKPEEFKERQEKQAGGEKNSPLPVVEEDGNFMTVFYHPWLEEARRRFPELRREMEALAKKNKESGQSEAKGGDSLGRDD